MAVQKHITKNVVDKKSKTGFCRFLFYHVFWAFLGEGSSKTPSKKYRKMVLTLFLFWPLTHPPTTGATDFFWPAPCIQLGQWDKSMSSRRGRSHPTALTPAPTGSVSLREERGLSVPGSESLVSAARLDQQQRQLCAHERHVRGVG
jgi:hypothetical protein